MRIDLRAAREWNMFRPGDRILCAVSGGADSMCLLHLLKSRAEEWGITVCAAHFEHGIRGEESLRDRDFVQQTCREWEIPFLWAGANVPAVAAYRGTGVEETARDLRYAFLRRAARDLHCTKIATAHNADDNAETLLFHLIRGTGTAGLCGIPPMRENLIRPLIDIPRAQIEAYNAEHQVPHVEDSTNACDDYTRNRIRHTILPLMKELNPALISTITRTSRLLSQDESALRTQALHLLGRAFSNDTGSQSAEPGGLSELRSANGIREAVPQSSVDLAYNPADRSIDSRALLSLPPAISSRIIRQLCPRALDSVHVDEILHLAASSEHASTHVPGCVISADLGRLYFITPETVQNSLGEAFEIRLPIPRTGEEDRGNENGTCPQMTLPIPQLGLTADIEITIYSPFVHTGFMTYALKYESISGGLRITSRRPGDSLRPAGRGCTKTLKSLFLEKRIKSPDRDRIPVLRDDLGIVAVLDAVDRRVAPKSGDRIVLIALCPTSSFPKAPAIDSHS